MVNLVLKYYILIFFVFLKRECKALDDITDMEVAISRGIMVEKIENIVLYTEDQHLNFFIPDLPDLPVLTSSDCTQQPFTQACSVTAKLNEINSDSLMLLTLINQMLTKNGLNEGDAQNVEVPDVILTSSSDSGTLSEPPAETFINAAGRDWYVKLRERLQLRKLSKKESDRVDRRRRSPFVGAIAKGVTGVAAMFGLNDLFDFVGGLFVSRDKILNILTTLKAYMPIDRQTFADVVRKTSEFEIFSKQKFAEIIKDGKDLRNITSEIEAKIRSHRLDFEVIQEGYSQTQRVIADTTTLLFTSILYMVQIMAFETCRSRELPLVFIPPSLLKVTLANLEKTLPDDVEFAIPTERSNLFYTMPGIAHCLYDDDGGTVRLAVPLVQKGALFELFKIKPIQFSWETQTCYLELDASYVVREKRTTMVHPVTAVDAARCDPIDKKTCKVPASTSDDTSSSCVSLILSGGTTEEIKSGCPIKCVPHSKPEISKVTDSIFIGTHIQPNSLVIQCPLENKTIVEDVTYGAIYISCPCSCLIKLDGRLVGRSTQQICQPNDILVVENILPAHFVIGQDLVHFTGSGSDAPRYKHREEIFDPEFLARTKSSEGDDSMITTKVNIYSVTWNALQSLLLAYSFFRIHSVAALVFQLANGMPRVQASTNHTCKLPYDAYILLISILVFTVLGVIPQIIFCAWRFVKKAFWQTVEIEAKKISIAPTSTNVESKIKSALPNKDLPHDKLSRHKSYLSVESDIDIAL